MTHLFKWPNKFADVFFISITDDEVQYYVRDKDTGFLVEPLRKAKYIVSGKMVNFDHRECPLDLFQHIHQVLS